MSLRFVVLASGSQGNAAFLKAGEFGVLIDCGIGPRILSKRLAQVGLDWPDIQAMVLTHTHTDHWNERTLTHFVKRRIPFYCHRGHHLGLADSEAFAQLRFAKLVEFYDARKPLILAPNLSCLPLPLSHDSGHTFGFHFEGSAQFLGPHSSMAYLTDLGTWTPALARAAANVDLLALEFNHDVALERQSGREPSLINRVLGDLGHLSNDQAACFVNAVLAHSNAGRLKHVVQLHLSQECNDAHLAGRVARDTLAKAGSPASVFTAGQDDVSPWFELIPGSRTEPQEAVG